MRIEYLSTSRVACLCFAIVPLCGCGRSTLDSIARKQVNVFVEVKDVLQDVTDEASAKAAVDKIKAIRGTIDAKMAELVAKANPQGRQELTNHYALEDLEIDKAITAQIARIGKNLAMKVHLDEAMKPLRER